MIKMDYYQIGQLVNAYQKCSEAEKVLGDITNMLGYRSQITLIDPIQNAIFNVLTEGLQSEHEQTMFNALTDGHVDEVFNLLNELEEK